MMKRLLFAAVAAVAFGLGAYAQSQEAVTVPYSSNLGTPDASSTSTGSVSSDWTAIDADPGKVTDVGLETETRYTNEWKYARNMTITGTGATCGVQLNTLAYWDTDDWLISPPIAMKAGTTYKISWYSYSTSNAMTYTTKIAQNVTAAEFETMKEEDPSLTYNGILDQKMDEGALIADITTTKNTIKQSVFTFTPETTGDYRFGFWFTCKKVSGGNLFLTKFEITEDALTPGVITDFTAIPVGNELKVDLSWKLPETDDAGNPISSSDIAEVKLWRGEELIVTLSGTSTSYTDNVPASGFYTYKVAAVGSKEGASTSVETSFVGIKEPYAVPYTADFSDAKMTQAFWTAIDANEDKKGWTYYNQYGSAYYQFDNYSTSISEDDWLITPGMQFEEAGSYRMTWTGNCANGLLKFVLGTEATLAGMTGQDAVEIGEVELATYSAVEKKLDFKISVPGVYYIGIQCAKTPSGGSSYYTKGFSVAELSEDDLYLTISIPEEGSMIFSCKEALEFGSVEGLGAYIAKVEDDYLTLEQINAVPASTGVILLGTEGSYKVPYISSAQAPEGNVIVATVTARNVSAGAYLYRDGSKGMGFYKTTVTSEVAAGSGYLPSTTGEALFISVKGGSVKQTTETISIGEDESMTYSSSHGLDFTKASGLTAYIVTEIENGLYVCKQVYKVPANTGILLKGDAGEYDVDFFEEAEEISGNLLRPAVGETNVTVGAFVYRNGNKGKGFYKLTEGMTLSGNSAYLPSYSSDLEFLGEKESSTVISVIELEADSQSASSIFDMQGRKVSKAGKGLYVIDGKLVMVK